MITTMKWFYILTTGVFITAMVSCNNTAENNDATVAAHGIDFGFRSVGRHHDVRRDAAEPRGAGERGGVIAG